MATKDKTERFLELIEKHNQLQRKRKEVLKELVPLQNEFAGEDKAFEAVIIVAEGAEIKVKIVNPKVQVFGDDFCTDEDEGVDPSALEREDGGELGLTVEPCIEDTFGGEFSSLEDALGTIFKTSQIKVLRQIK